MFKMSKDIMKSQHSPYFWSTQISHLLLCQTSCPVTVYVKIFKKTVIIVWKFEKKKWLIGKGGGKDHFESIFQKKIKEEALEEFGFIQLCY